MSEHERRDSGREGIGILSTLREALDEVINEARDKGGMNAERAREAMKVAMNRARVAAEEARERLDFATEQDVQELRDAVAELKVRLENLERRMPQDASAGASRAQGPTGGSEATGL
jgi:polyhydroxyalkanoate synthesis regulator phasin